MQLLLLWTLCVRLLFGQNKYCYDEFSCVNESIVQNNGDISCYGLGSCADAIEIYNIRLSEDTTTRCWGSRSCQNAAILDGDVTYPSDIRGFLGLAWSKHVLTDKLVCYGEATCINIENVESKEITCYGFRSCEGINATNSTKIRARGMLSLTNAMLYNPLYVQLEAFFSGYNTTIYCESGYSCTIECFVNGCENLNIICHDAANCFVKSCNNSNGIICPNVYNISGNQSYNSIDYRYSYKYYEHFLKKLDNIFRSYSNNYSYILNDTIYIENKHVNYECSNIDVQCNDYMECDGRQFSHNFNDNICCNAYRTCATTTLPEPFASASSNDITSNIYCDADASCVGAEFDAVANYTNIYARGRYGITESKLSNFSKILCNGMESGELATMKYSNYLGCFGYFSCVKATLIGVKNIFAAGFQSLKNSTIISGYIGKMNIYFLGYQTNINNIINITCSSGDICNLYCLSSQACDFLSNDSVHCESGCEINWIYINATYDYSYNHASTTTTTTISGDSSTVSNYNSSIVHSTDDVYDANDTFTTWTTNAWMSTTEGSLNSNKSKTDIDSNGNNNNDHTSPIWLILGSIILGLFLIIFICAAIICKIKKKNLKGNNTPTKSKFPLSPGKLSTLSANVGGLQKVESVNDSREDSREGSSTNSGHESEKRDQFDVNGVGLPGSGRRDLKASKQVHDKKSGVGDTRNINFHGHRRGNGGKQHKYGEPSLISGQFSLDGIFHKIDRDSNIIGDDHDNSDLDSEDRDRNKSNASFASEMLYHNYTAKPGDTTLATSSHMDNDKLNKIKEKRNANEGIKSPERNAIVRHDNDDIQHHPREGIKSPEHGAVVTSDGAVKVTTMMTKLGTKKHKVASTTTNTSSKTDSI